MQTENSVRAFLVESLRRDLVGPSPQPPQIQENGEEILIQSPPRLRYCVGILFPRQTVAISLEELTEETAADDEADNVLFSGEESAQTDENDDDPIDGANSLLPSALGFSCRAVASQFGVCVRVGRYESGETLVETRGKVEIKKCHFRRAIEWNRVLDVVELPAAGRAKSWPITQNDASCGLVLYVHNRSKAGQDGDGDFWTWTLVNEKIGGRNISDADCFFQVEITVVGKDDAPFLPMPSAQTFGRDNTQHDDARSADLLYRERHTFAVGHGCAASWHGENGGQAREIRSETLPLFDLKPIVPAHFPELDLTMNSLANGDFSSLTPLCESYEKWIEQQSQRAELLLNIQRATAKNHLAQCRDVLSRMRDGVELLQSDARVRRAFTLMNRAMLLQQMHAAQPTRRWRIEKNGYEPVIESWQRPQNPPRGRGAWRPFQLVFVLMNLRGALDPLSHSRQTLDLIWFPTGGGKTEAYLGLAAFTIFLGRLLDRDADGTVVLMRYTLRLLTAQQYSRAASLICACETLRIEYSNELGDARITIGLWVGGATTPNTRADAVLKLKELSRGDKNNPFVILKCPWCGAEMGPIRDDKGKTARVQGYRDVREPSRVELRCHDKSCDFSKTPLPLLVVDEDIYAQPPTVLLGTVDKFAALTWKPQSRAIFGFRDDETRVAPPQLIIQDELHLISGPLGSMVGLYETLIAALCEDPIDKSSPKIVASTATIARAREQCHALFGCEDRVTIFPPSGLDAGDSFFAREDKNAKGRWYLGVQGVAQKAVQVQVRVVACLLQAVKSAPVADEKERDAYWTLLGYFNSLRELGYASSLLSSSVGEYLNRLRTRDNVSPENRRYINRTLELTSRIPSFQIPENLSSLEIEYSKPDDETRNEAIDICLATNMVSVGVDVSRLGLMVMTGQPKTTAEYIQATSRVGRDQRGPGLVVTVFNSSRARDRSHMERFWSYHNAIYRDVEPTSVTPFSSPARERALHAITVGYLRCFGEHPLRQNPQPLPPDELIAAIRAVVERRVSCIESEERDATLRLFDERMDEWRRWGPPVYGGFNYDGKELPLLFAAGTTPPNDWIGKVWPTLYSMRDVDASCEAKVPNGYNRVLD